MAKYSDTTITCSQCGKEFIFSEDEQEFYKLKGFNTPQRCKQCRLNNRLQSTPVCAKCGNKISNKDDITCVSCLTVIQSNSDAKVKEIQGELDGSKAKIALLESERSIILADANERLSSAQAEASRLLEETNVRLAASESEKDGISKLLQQKEQRIVELEWRLDETHKELEKARQYRMTLEGLQPALIGLDGKLGLMERNQNSLIQALLQIVDKLDEKHKPGIVEILRDLVRLDSSRTARE